MSVFEDRGVIDTKNILRKKDGYVLVWVIIVFIIVGLLSTVIVSDVVVAMRSTDTQYNSQQAYFSAKSAASAVADYILENDGDSAIVSKLISTMGSGSSEQMGDYTVSVSYVSTSKIRVSATATFRGEKKVVSVYLVKPPIPAGVIPTNMAIYLNSSSTSGIGQCVVNGDIYVDGDLKISEGTNINGIVIVKGQTTIEGGANTTNGVISFGNITMNNGGAINGDVLTKGDLKMTGGSIIAGNAYADGSLDFWEGGNVGKNVVIGNNAKFGGGGNKIKGTFSYGGNLSFAWGNIFSYVASGGIKTTNYTPLDFSNYSSPDLPIVSAPTQSEKPEMYNPVTIINKIISNSGTLTSTVVTALNQLSYGSVVTIDASAQDIYLLLDDTSFNLSNGINIEVIGTHKVFLYMTGTSKLLVSSNEYIGMRVRGANPQLYIFGDGEQTITLSNNSELNACVYMPQGFLSASGSSLTSETYKFVGTCIINAAGITSNVKFQYSEPELNNSPLSIFQSQSSGSSYAGWSIESWGSN